MMAIVIGVYSNWVSNFVISLKNGWLQEKDISKKDKVGQEDDAVFLDAFCSRSTVHFIG